MLRKAILYCGAAWCLSSTFGQDWKTMEKQMRSEIQTWTGEFDLTQLEAVKSLVSTKQSAPLLEMALQVQAPIVSAAGLVGLNRLDRSLAYQAAVRLAWTAEENDNRNILGPALAEVLMGLPKGAVGTDDIIRGLNVVMTFPPRSLGNASLVLLSIPKRDLSQWLSQSSDTGVLPSNMALVIDQLFKESVGEETALKEKMLGILYKNRGISGLPSQVYLKHWTRIDKEYENVLVRVLNDPLESLNWEPFGLLLRRAIVRERRELIERMLAERPSRFTSEAAANISKDLSMAP